MDKVCQEIHQNALSDTSGMGFNLVFSYLNKKKHS